MHKNILATLLTALSALAWPLVAEAQGPASAADASAPAASAPRTKAGRPKPPPRQLSPTEQREVDAPPLDKPPQGEVQPQIHIPLTRKQPSTNKPHVQPGKGEGPAGGNINDAAARCEAQPSEQARAQCREEHGLRR
jgi:hypothetical protein